MKLKIGELAARAGLTVRTLHHYDEIGLLGATERSDSGHRLYGNSDILRLYRIMALARLGIPLAEVAAALDAGGAELHAVIARQRAVLDAQIARAILLRERLERLHVQFDSNDEQALDDCLQTLEFMSVIDKYFSREEIDAIAERKPPAPNARERYAADWRALIAEVRAQMDLGADPAGPDARQLARRWQALIEVFTGGDPALAQKLATMYDREGGLEAHTGIDAGMRAFMRRALTEPE
jgi:DNA-binding transcriptional MerR regulator